MMLKTLSHTCPVVRIKLRHFCSAIDSFAATNHDNLLHPVELGGMRRASFFSAVAKRCITPAHQFPSQVRQSQ